MCNKEDKKVATGTLYNRYTLSESDAQKILSTPRTKLPEIDIFNDIKLKRHERLTHAANILKSRKCK